MKFWLVGVCVGLVLAGQSPGDTFALDQERYLDKCKGAWVGQMIGVCFGDIYEFKSNGKTVEGPLEPWKPERIRGAIGQDDCYVEMTFLKTLETHGLNPTYEQAGADFAATQFPLWHANRVGRDNVRRGIMPPLSGHFEHNRHADDIDFQIEADLFGILCPGMPQESNRLGNIFGHIMNYGDGVYGGLFVAGMYTEAYFEDNDVEKVVRAGLACIPAESLYYKCIADVIEWHKEHPGDWLAAWNKIEEKWQDDVDCAPGDPFNIDAKLNGAYIVMGLLYGGGDLAKTLEIAVRCGQDNDCNPSNAAGVLCCMKGFSALDPHWTDGFAAIEDTRFDHTGYSFKTLIPACRKLTEAIIRQAGGEVKDGVYLINRQEPKAPEPLEQWTDQMKILSVPIMPAEMAAWNPAWRLAACGTDMQPGIHRKFQRDNVLLLHPVNRETPAVITAELAVPSAKKPVLEMEVTSDPKGDFVLKVFVNDSLAVEKRIASHGKWQTVTVDLSKYAGQTVPVRIENHANGWEFEAAYVSTVRIAGAG
ncbi:MAG TPA: ADP-ribosylglycohydrolase family protein [Candidatus Hydrogenedentes bacterium]|nr:ADP-ribosylglycohydrolase family protein [Candidatus Hydrogenedentota bacterium]HRT19849.1 ADP-ribosylglycohydrolase family protein [Candidatus Hydrogenedentota bacterium]HRT65429.1 ADP-ribosylglycohydrolase family protein [Candidatus Hydrogenedentota bacterium]